MKHTKPLVSVIIPTYKRSAPLCRAIDSVLAQTYPDIEVVVVDDNDPDTQWRTDTEKIMVHYAADSRVVYIRHPKNCNGAAARNTGIRVSHGEYVGFLDDDDWYYPTKIEKQVAFLDENPAYSGCYCGLRRSTFSRGTGPVGDLSYQLLSGTYLVWTPLLLLRREILEHSGGWDEDFRRHQEAALQLRIFRVGGTLGAVPEILCEVDMSDRQNVAPPRQNEENTDLYLDRFAQDIARCEQARPGAAKRIYCYRYRSVLLNYAASHWWKDILRVMGKALRKYPLFFSWSLLTYAAKRLTGRKQN